MVKYKASAEDKRSRAMERLAKTNKRASDDSLRKCMEKETVPMKQWDI